MGPQLKNIVPQVGIDSSYILFHGNSIKKSQNTVLVTWKCSLYKNLHSMNAHNLYIFCVKKKFIFKKFTLIPKYILN